jgi:hypothetical protein
VWYAIEDVGRSWAENQHEELNHEVARSQKVELQNYDVLHDEYKIELRKPNKRRIIATCTLTAP